MVKKALNAARMKERNYSRFFRELRLRHMTRAQVARAMGLTRSSTSIIAEEFISAGIILEGSNSQNEQHRSKDLFWNKDYCYVGGIRLNRDAIHVGICDLCGTLIDSTSFPVDECETGVETIIKTGKLIQQMINKNNPSGSLLGVGVAAPGPLDAKSGIVLDPPYFDLMHNVPVTPLLRDLLKCEIILENDANALALAEQCYGIQNRYDRFLKLIVDTGIGASLILDGKLIVGPSGLGNGFGHASINIGGIKCPCGNEGCLEMYAAIPRIVEAARKADPTLTSWKIITDRAYTGDLTAMDVLRSEARYLAAIIVSASNVLDIQAVIIDGEYVLYRPTILFKEMEKEVNKRVTSRSARTIEILPSQILGNANVLSSTNLVIERFIEQPFKYMKNELLSNVS